VAAGSLPTLMESHNTFGTHLQAIYGWKNGLMTWKWASKIMNMIHHIFHMGISTTLFDVLAFL
jgi:hypothetical protein